ncbi:MAG: type II toxin-antitoxin system RelE/ParE family toxin [Burkholderiaceae bacterium]|jgi:putative addiction module killer protein|nr:type II toxin-antitoxin system RelE/ParE family toxin [Burkholderiaceae bacterium]
MEYFIAQTDEFEQWLVSLKDRTVRRMVVARIERIRNGNFGDHKTFGSLGELRFKSGAGIRVYYTIRKQQIVFLLAGGDKTTQQKDFEKARAMIAALED